MAYRMKEIKALTSLRGIFAIWVVFFHLRAWSALRDSPLVIIDKGYLGVDFFFMLSGFILAGAHGLEVSGANWFAGYLSFLIKRFGRLFPLHIVVLTVVCFLLYIDRIPQYWWTNIVTEAALAHRWGFIYSPRAALNGPDWSISTEWAANLLLPVFIAGSGTSDHSILRPLVMAVVSISILFFLIFLHGTMDISEANSYLPIMRCFAEFSLGVLLFRHSHFLRALSSDLVISFLVFAIVVGLVLRYDLLVICMMIPLLPALAQNDGSIHRALSARPLHWLGEISYSIYLVQIPFITGLDRLFTNKFAPILHWSLVPAIIIMAGSVAHYTVEIPSKKIIKKLLRLLSKNSRQKASRIETSQI